MKIGIGSSGDVNLKMLELLQQEDQSSEWNILTGGDQFPLFVYDDSGFEVLTFLLPCPLKPYSLVHVMEHKIYSSC